MIDIKVRTTSGWVEGAKTENTVRWLGIPYAHAERFGPPGPPQAWEGTRPAKVYGAQCPQRRGSASRRAKINAPDFGEDCLNLNVWTPASGGTDLKPVMVWIHGGAFLIGGSNTYDGYELAVLGDMVVVTLNYRLGILGFANFTDALDLPQIPSNLGLRDQIAALEWVRDNIQAFGGDPARVTIAGESAGSISISLLMLCRRAWPLFHGAIMQSGALSLIHGREKSRQVGEKLAGLIGAEAGDIESLRRVELLQLFHAQAIVDSQERNSLPVTPWFDGDLLPASLAEARTAPTAPVPLLAGANREEIRIFEVMPGDLLPIDWPDLERVLRSQLPAEQVEAILATYPRTKSGRRALATDLTFNLPTRHFVERHSATNPAWFYRFDYAHPLLGACHALDLAFLWPIRGVLALIARGGPLSGARAGLAERIKTNWAHFVRTGRPMPDWLPYTKEIPQVKLLNRKDQMVTEPDAHRYAAWAGHDVGPALATDVE